MESCGKPRCCQKEHFGGYGLDTDYYPAITHQRMVPQDGKLLRTRRWQQLDGMIENVVKGSNVSRIRDRNESGDVHSGGAPVLQSWTGERFVQENR